jgi:spermidine/putrescine transport system substrate-binding protein
MPEHESMESLIERLIAEERISRRQLVRRAGGAGLGFSGLAAFLAACGGVEGTADKNKASTTPAASHPKVAIGAMTFSNWPLYIDRSVLRTWDKQTGGKVKYIEDINDNEEFFGKVRPQLQSGRSIGRDLVAITDWMAGRWVRLGYAEPIDKANVPNFKNLRADLANPNFDPGRKYTLPWQSGMTAIGYNPKKTGGKLDTLEALFDPKFKGRTTMFTDARDSTGLTMLTQGVNPEKATIDQVLKAIDKIDQANRKGQFRRFTGNDYTQDLTNGNVWVAMAYSGDVGQLKKDNPDLEFIIPAEGAMRWSDNMIIPQKAAHPYAAETFMNLVYEPEIAARITEAVGYVSPVEGVKAVLDRKDPKLAEDPTVFPPDDLVAKLRGYPNLNADEEQRMNEAMQQVVGA